MITLVVSIYTFAFLGSPNLKYALIPLQPIALFHGETLE